MFFYIVISVHFSSLPRIPPIVHLFYILCFPFMDIFLLIFCVLLLLNVVMDFLNFLLVTAVYSNFLMF